MVDRILVVVYLGGGLDKYHVFRILMAREHLGVAPFLAQPTPFLLGLLFTFDLFRCRGGGEVGGGCGAAVLRWREGEDCGSRV